MGNKQNNANKDKKYIYKYYILFIGSNGIGTKTSLIKRIKGGKYVDVTKDNNTIYEKITYIKDNKEFILYLIDAEAAKKEKTESNLFGENETVNFISDSQYNADCIIMGYDLTNKQSFEEIKTYWNNTIKDKFNINLLYLLGNKMDLKNKIEVDEDEVKEFADKNNIKHFQISVKNNLNIKNFITDLKMNIEKKDDNSPILYGNPSKKEYKVILLGESGVGAKTSLINRLVYNIFYDQVLSTAGASCSSKLIKLKNGKEIIINFWDTVGQEKYRSLTKFFIKDSDCVVLGYDITKKDSFENIKYFWYKCSQENVKTDLYYLIGNKSDLFEKETVSEIEARDYAKENNMKFFLVSCCNDSGIKPFLNDLASKLIKK